VLLVGSMFSPPPYSWNDWISCMKRTVIQVYLRCGHLLIELCASVCFWWHFACFQYCEKSLLFGISCGTFICGLLGCFAVNFWVVHEFCIFRHSFTVHKCVLVFRVSECAPKSYDLRECNCCSHSILEIDHNCIIFYDSGRTENIRITACRLSVAPTSTTGYWPTFSAPLLRSTIILFCAVGFADVFHIVFVFFVLLVLLSYLGLLICQGKTY